MLSMPNYSSVEVFTLPEDRYLYSDIVLAHQKSGKGFEKLDSYLNRYFIDSAKIKNISLEDYTYLTQCLQYYVVKNIAGTHRSKEPYNMGTLIWQLNDCWPTASWSITDYYNREPRASWYAIREAYRDDVKPETDFIRPRDLSLEDPKINWEIKGNNIIIKALKMAKYVYISMKGYNGKWSDNYFDLKAGEEKTISFEGKITKPEIKIYSLFEVLEKYK